MNDAPPAMVLPAHGPRGPLRHLADLLSAANAACGFASIAFAASGRVDVSLVLLLVGAVFDGLDGAAARRFGGTRLGVLADDVADAVSYAVAPGVAIAHVVQGVAGTIVGVAFVALTVTRLVYFTLKKADPKTDPRHFRGLPSTVGGVVALSAAILFPAEPSLVAFVAGMAVVLMVSFDAGFLHLGRALGELAPPVRRAVTVVVIVVTAAALALGPRALATVGLASALAYAFGPHARAFADALAAGRRAAEAGLGRAARADR